MLTRPGKSEEKLRAMPDTMGPRSRPRPRPKNSYEAEVKLCEAETIDAVQVQKRCIRARAFYHIKFINTKKPHSVRQ